MAAERSDWYSSTLEGEREMYAAITANLNSVDKTLAMDADKKARLLEMAQVFMAYDDNLTLNRAALKALSTGFNTIMNGKTGIDPMPDTPTFQTLTLPAGDFVGMEAEMRDIRRYMTGLFTWTENMGDLLKMNGKEATGRNEDQMSPSVVIKSIEGNRIYVSTKKEGMDGIEFQWREAGASVWQPLMNSGDAETVLEIPLAAGAAEKIEIRAVFLKKFKRVGNWSPTYNAAVGN